MSPFAELFAVHAKCKTVITTEKENIIAWFFNGKRRIYIHKKITAITNITKFWVTKTAFICKINAINFNGFGHFNIACLMNIGNTYTIFTDDNIKHLTYMRRNNAIHNRKHNHCK